jgi:peptidoglycan/LPS O-acetylase OafA/YrhL
MVMIAHWAQWQFTNELIASIPFVHGVILFFVLSGFLITRILMQGAEAGGSSGGFLKKFYIRRVLRIFPIYYLLIFTLFISNYQNTRDIFFWLATYTINIFQAIRNEYVGDFNHFWSLGVEEQFYLFWPLIILFIARKRWLAVILCTISLSIFFRTIIYLTNGNWMMNSYSTPGCMYALGLGALLAYWTLYREKAIAKISRPEIVYSVLLLYLASLILNDYFDSEAWKQIGDDCLFGVLSLLLICGAFYGMFKGLAKKFLENRFVNYAGRISYGLYVYHLFIPALYYWIAQSTGYMISNKYVLFTIFFIMTFIVAHFSWIFIERPVNRLKLKFPYSVSAVQ